MKQAGVYEAYGPLVSSSYWTSILEGFHSSMISLYQHRPDMLRGVGILFMGCIRFTGLPIVGKMYDEFFFSTIRLSWRCSKFGGVCSLGSPDPSSLKGLRNLHLRDSMFRHSGT